MFLLLHCCEVHHIQHIKKNVNPDELYNLKVELQIYLQPKGMHNPERSKKCKSNHCFQMVQIQGQRVRCGYLIVKRKTIVIGNIWSKKITPSLTGNTDELEHWSYTASIIYNLPNSEHYVCLSMLAIKTMISATEKN